MQPHEAVVEEYPVVRDVAVERGFAEAAAFVDVHLEPFGADEIHQLARDFDAFDGRRDGERDEAAPLSRGRHACEHAAAAVRRRAGLDEADDAFFLFRRQLRAGAELHDGDVYSAAAHERRVACDYFVRRDEVFESARDVAAGAYPSVSGGDVGKDGARQREKFFSVEAGFARRAVQQGRSSLRHIRHHPLAVFVPLSIRHSALKIYPVLRGGRIYEKSRSAKPRLSIFTEAAPRPGRR